MIKLRLLVPKHVIQESPDLPPPEASHLDRPAWHAYAKPASDAAGKQYFQGNIDYNNSNSDQNIVEKAAGVIKKFENSIDNPRGGFDRAKKRWFPHRSIEGGTPTIAYGHKMKPNEDLSAGLTDAEAETLLRKDISGKIEDLKRRVKNFDSLPMTIKIAAINASFRGDLGPKTIALLGQNQFAKAAKEYLNHNEYRTTKNLGVKKRMEWNAKVFASIS